METIWISTLFYFNKKVFIQNLLSEIDWFSYFLLDFKSIKIAGKFIVRNRI